MELRYRLAVVTGADGATGREVAVRLGQAGARVLLAGPDPSGLAETAAQVRVHRTWAACVQADTREEYDARLLAARVRDLGGATLVLDTVGGAYAALLRQLLGDDGPPPVWLTPSELAGCTVAETVRALREHDPRP